ncbi:MAG: PLP-dependent lyase/thiolase [Patescibacteria group bacterium]
MTPLIKIDSIFLKREDQNPTGSAKDRALLPQVQNLKSKGFSKAVISSTGNAAISAQFYCRKFQIPLTIFLPPAASPEKLKLLGKFTISPRPISDAIKFAKANHAYLLRQSTDPVALEGYQQIGQELIFQLPQISSLFVPVGSGTTLLGISQSLPQPVKIFAVQPASHCPISSLFDKNYSSETSSLTDSLGAKYLPLKNNILKAIRESGGGGVVVQNRNIEIAQSFLINNKIITSSEGALALAGYRKIKEVYNVGNYPVILLTGAKR